MDGGGICEEALANGQWVCKRWFMDGRGMAFLSLRWCEHAGLVVIGVLGAGNEFEVLTRRSEGIMSKGLGKWPQRSNELQRRCRDGVMRPWTRFREAVRWY
jgi:hypothetical protein